MANGHKSVCAMGNRGTVNKVQLTKAMFSTYSLDISSYSCCVINLKNSVLKTILIIYYCSCVCRLLRMWLIKTRLSQDILLQAAVTGWLFLSAGLQVRQGCSMTQISHDSWTMLSIWQQWRLKDECKHVLVQHRCVTGILLFLL